jgi:hypothetical protein
MHHFTSAQTGGREVGFERGGYATAKRKRMGEEKKKEKKKKKKKKKGATWFGINFQP